MQKTEQTWALGRSRGSEPTDENWEGSSYQLDVMLIAVQNWKRLALGGGKLSFGGDI